MIPEEKLRAALEEYENALIASLPEPGQCDHQFSEGFEKKMRRVRRRARHPAAYKALQRAACVLLAAVSLFVGAVMFDADARASVLDWIRERWGDFSHYVLANGSGSEEKTGFQLGVVPDGYKLKDSNATATQESLVYINESGQMVYLTYVFGSDLEQITELNPLFIGGEDYDQYSASVNGHTADIYITSQENKNNGIVWADAEQGVLFLIAAPMDEEGLIELAESVTEKK